MLWSVLGYILVYLVSSLTEPNVYVSSAICVCVVNIVTWLVKLWMISAKVSVNTAYMFDMSTPFCKHWSTRLCTSITCSKILNVWMQFTAVLKHFLV